MGLIWSRFCLSKYWLQSKYKLHCIVNGDCASIMVIKCYSCETVNLFPLQCTIGDLANSVIYFRGNSLRDAASVAYAQVFAPHHGRAIRMAVAAGMYALPSKSQLLKKLNEDGE